MGTNNDDSNHPDDHETRNTNASQANISVTTMPRAHSNLDILSQTAAVIEEVSICASSSTTVGSNESSSCSIRSDASPPQPARVTPAEHHHHYHSNNTYSGYQIKQTNAYYPVDDPCQKYFLSVPEMSSSSLSPNGGTKEFHAGPQPSIFLEKKRGFLPPALSFETGGGILVGGQPFSMEAASSSSSLSNYYSPGLYLSYSNGSAVTATSGTVTVGGHGNHVTTQRVMSPPQDQVTSQQHQHQPLQVHTTLATVSTTGSNNSGGSSPPNGGDGDTAVNSFLANPSHSFSSAGGASVSSLVNIAAASSTQYQFTGSHPPFPMHHAAFVPPPPPPPQRTDNATGTTSTNKGGIEFSDDMLRENFVLRQQLAARDATISSLQNQLESLQHEVRQLRQVPSGKISQIPLEDMLAIMREYGSEVSDTAMPPRKSFVQKASVVRQFRRWNPNFTDWFVHISGKWIPKLGPEGEKKRRQEARLAYSEQKSKKQKIGSGDDNGTTGTTGGDAESLRPEDVPVAASVPHPEESQVKTDSGKVKRAGPKNLENVMEI